MSTVKRNAGAPQSGRAPAAANSTAAHTARAPVSASAASAQATPVPAPASSTSAATAQASPAVAAPHRRPPPAREDLPSQADVARGAGVSTATVSRVFNHPELVRPAVAVKVAAVAQALGYVPDSAGRALSSRRTQVAGMIVPTIDEPGLARSVEAVQQSLEAGGHALLLACSGGDPERELAQARMLVGRGVEALVLAGPAHLPALRSLLDAQGVPVVCLDFADAAWPGVGFDRRAAGAVAGRHLLELGHTRLALLASAGPDGRAVAEWTAGIAQALALRGATLSGDRVRVLPRDFDAARAATRDLLRLPLPPTALVCDHDLLALGAMRECVAQGIAVPDRVSVVGCGDVDLARQALPALSTLRVSAVDLGRLTAESLLRCLAGEAPADWIEVPVKLVMRGSTGPPPAS